MHLKIEEFYGTSGGAAYIVLWSNNFFPASMLLLLKLLTANSKSLEILSEMSCDARKTGLLGFRNWAVRQQKMARGLKFQI